MNSGGIHSLGIGAALIPTLVSALDSTTASIGLQSASFTPEQHSTTLSSVEYEPNTNYDPCVCDLTSYTCDAFCCCDSDCNQVNKIRN